MKLICALALLMPAAVSVALMARPGLWKALSVAAAAGEAALCTIVCFLPAGELTLFYAGGLRFALRPDALGCFFALLFSLLILAALIFNLEYMEDGERQNQLCAAFLMTLAALVGACWAGNIQTFYCFFELVTLCSFAMVLHDRTPSARAAALKYICYSMLGASMALFGLFFAPRFLTSLTFTAGGALCAASAASAPGLLAACFLLMIFGFGCKAGLMPLQDWLPTAHPEAPATASAVLSGVITKAGLLGIIRCVYYMFGPELYRGSWVQYLLIAAALFTVFGGSLLALMERKLKKRLAYSTVSQLSYALFGVFLFCPGGLEGALLQSVFHGLAKVTLFLCAGAMIHATGREYVRDENGAFQYAGIGRAMPGVMLSFTFASLSLIGIPPFGGFGAKWYLALAGLEALGAFGWIGAAVLLLSALMTAGYLLDIVTGAFFPRGGERVSVLSRPSWRMYLPSAALAGATLLLGIFSPPLTNFFSSLAGTAM